MRLQALGRTLEAEPEPGGGGARATALVSASEEVAVRVPQNSSYLRFRAPLALGEVFLLPNWSSWSTEDTANA